MPRAFRRTVVTTAPLTAFALPFENNNVYPDTDKLTADGIALLVRPFTAGSDTGPEALIVAPGYNYARDSVTLDLVVPDTTIFNNSPSPITT